VRVVVAVAYAAALPFLVERYGVEAAGAALVVSSVAIALGMLWLLLRQRSRAGQRHKAA
jgi:hypothetical protein